MFLRTHFGMTLAFVLVGTFCVTPAQEKAGALEGLSTGKTRIVDLSYAINDKLVAWPGDPKVFEAKTNGSVEKDGYFTRSFWMLEHYGTHLDAPAHFPRGRRRWKKLRRKNSSVRQSSWMFAVKAKRTPTTGSLQP